MFAQDVSFSYLSHTNDIKCIYTAGCIDSTAAEIATESPT